jgi:hypothetical protein
VAVISALYPWPDKLDIMSKPDVYGGVRAFIEVLKSTTAPKGRGL